MAKVSFTKTEGAGKTAPVEKIVTEAATASAASQQSGTTGAPAETTALATPSHGPTTALGFYTGEDDNRDIDPRDTRLPKLNIVQGMSGDDIKAIGPEGTIVLNKAIALPQPVRLVIYGFRPKIYCEKMPKFGQEGSRTAHNLQEVADFGGTDQWRLSRENKEAGSKKPYFEPSVTAAVLIEKPAQIDPGAEELFSVATSDGKFFAPALFWIKGISYGGFFVKAQSELKLGLLRAGYATHVCELTSAIPPRSQNEAYAAQLRVLSEATSAAVRAAVKATFEG